MKNVENKVVLITGAASGIGRETHKVILDHYTQMKNIMINIGETPTGFYPVK